MYTILLKLRIYHSLRPDCSVRCLQYGIVSGVANPAEMSKIKRTESSIAVYALSLHLSPSNAPCAVARRGRNWYDTLDIFGAKVGKLHYMHPTHRASNN